MSKENKIPKTKEECFAVLDAMLSDEDKATIAAMEDTIELHFGLGMWIRNNWIYQQSEDDVKTLMRNFIDVDGNEDDFNYYFDVIQPDDYSAMILDAYQEYLKTFL